MGARYLTDLADVLRAAGLTSYAGATYPAFILVEDIGPA